MGGFFVVLGGSMWLSVLYAMRRKADREPNFLAKAFLDAGRQALAMMPRRGRTLWDNLEGIGLFGAFTAFLVVGTLLVIRALGP